MRGEEADEPLRRGSRGGRLRHSGRNHRFEEGQRQRRSGASQYGSSGNVFFGNKHLPLSF
jgi:hypothetical protein